MIDSSFFNTPILSDCFPFLASLPDNSVDSLLTDPPSGTGFMGKEWDNHSRYEPQTERAKEVLPLLQLLGLQKWEAGFIAFTCDWATAVFRVLKPGAMGLVWALPRTSGLTTLGLRLAGFEIRDSVYHLFGTGYPKIHDVGKAVDKELGAKREVVGKGYRKLLNSSMYSEDAGGGLKENFNITTPATDEAKLWDGWQTALKPAVEPWVLIMKPLDGTYAENALKWGVAGLNIGGCRIGDEERINGVKKGTASGDMFIGGTQGRGKVHVNGRHPAHLILDPFTAGLLDEQSGVSSGKQHEDRSQGQESIFLGSQQIKRGTSHTDTGGASRFFYVAKPSASEKHAKITSKPARRDEARNSEQPSMNGGEGNPYNRGAKLVKNTHPTVKPIELMRYLLRLLRTPHGGITLDCFAGSGTTFIAGIMEGQTVIGCERDPIHHAEALERINNTPQPLPFGFPEIAQDKEPSTIQRKFFD